MCVIWQTPHSVLIFLDLGCFVHPGGEVTYILFDRLILLLQRHRIGAQANTLIGVTSSLAAVGLKIHCASLSWIPYRELEYRG